MKPYCITEGFVRDGHVKLFYLVRSLVETFPDGLNCHQVCERVLRTFRQPLAWIKGTFNGYDHSWLVILGTRIIIDPYPWACASGPIMLDCQTGSPWTTLYRESEYVLCDPDGILQHQLLHKEVEQWD